MSVLFNQNYWPTFKCQSQTNLLRGRTAWQGAKTFLIITPLLLPELSPMYEELQNESRFGQIKSKLLVLGAVNTTTKRPRMSTYDGEVCIN